MSGFRDLASFSGTVIRHPSPLPNRARAVARFAYRQLHKRLVKRPMIVRWEGTSLEIPLDSNSASAAYYFGRQDWWEFAFLERFLRHGDLVLDVGANVGVYTLFLAKLVGAAGEVLACEPEPGNLERLRRNVERNRLEQVTIIPAAVGAEPGTAEFAAGLDSVGHVVTAGTSPEATSPEANLISVPLTTVDALCSGRTPIFAKVDVEGFEEDVLRGAEEQMAAGAPVCWQLELLHARPLESSRVAAMLEHRGYRFCVYDIRSNSLRRREWHAARGNNLLAVRDVERITERLREE